MSDSYTNIYNPDVLSTLANLSSDEVFTPPHIVNQMLDMLPQELFKNKNTTFLDPATKSGVFLREIAKRLLVGLEKEIPNLQERIDHIFKKQLFGIAITEMTSLLSRRSVYCSKYPNSKYSISLFPNSDGNIRYVKINHTWNENKCIYCGANKVEFNRSVDFENYSYEFIHNFKEIFTMKFDVIIGNPPYQISDGGAQSSAIPIYHRFVDQAMKLKPRFLSMIVPSRWFSGGKGLDDFRDRHIKDLRYKKIVDFFDSNDCFPGVKIEGGVNYFLWERDYQGECEVKSIYKGEVVSVSNRKLSTNGSDIFIRQNEGVDIYKKILKKSTNFFNKIVSPQKPFGLRTFIVPEDNKTKNSIVLYGNKKIGYYDVNKIESNKEWIPKFKVFISMAYGVGKSIPQQVLNKPILGYPGSACTETYVLIGPFETKTTAENVLNYIQTKFFRYLVSLRKNTQHASQSVYSFVPLLDYSIGWTDEMLFSYFDLSSTEIELINNSIKDMSNKENSEEEEI